MMSTEISLNLYDNEHAISDDLIGAFNRLGYEHKYDSSYSSFGADYETFWKDIKKISALLKSTKN